MKKHLIKLYAFLLVASNTVYGQFTIFNPLKTSDATGLAIGDNAYLTAAKGIDPNGAGYLRLTQAATNRKGYMYVQQSFPTSLGITADFEYLAWRDVDDSYHGADGFTMFLFDGNTTTFKLGGYGGSLGYAPLQGSSTTGLTGGYIGIGFDAYGNYGRLGEDRRTGVNYYIPNSVVLRGPTTGTLATTNAYLTHKELGDRSGSADDIRKRDEIDYNTKVTKRPSESTFYRRVQVIITKLANNNYRIVGQWRKQNQTTFTELFSYEMNSATYQLPSTLKIGFAGSTGGGFNHMEIRNILITTPGNIRVDSRSDEAMVCKGKTSETTFKIEVTNDTAANLNNITYNTKFTDASGNLLDLSNFKITSLTRSSEFTSASLQTSNFTSNEISGIVGLPANKSGIITIKGNYFGGLPTNSQLKATSNISSVNIVDPDLTNNNATTSVDVRKCNIISNPNLPINNQ